MGVHVSYREPRFKSVTLEGPNNSGDLDNDTICMKKIKGRVAQKYSLGSCSGNFTPQRKSVAIEDNQAKNYGKTKIQRRQ